MLSRKKKILFLLILLLFPIAALLLLEIGLRCFWPQPPRGFSDHLFTSRDGLTCVAPGTSGHQYSREFETTIVGNALGYRTHPGFNPELPPDLVILGDSFAFGWGVEANDVVGAVVATQTGWNVYSLAMPGDGIFSSKKRLARLQAQANPPAVLLFFDNDLSDYIGTSPENISPEKLALPVLERNPAQTRLNIHDLRHNLLESHLVRLTGRVIDWSGLSNAVAGLAGSDRIRQQAIDAVMAIHCPAFFESPAWLLLESGYADFFRLAEAKTSRLLFIRIVPPFFSELKRKNDERYDYDICDTRLRSLCRVNNVEYFTFEPEDTDRYYFRYDMHLTPDGHRKLARFILEKLSIEKIGEANHIVHVGSVGCGNEE